MCCTGPAALFNPPLPLVNDPLDWGGTVAYHGVTKYGRPFFAGFRDGGGPSLLWAAFVPGPHRVRLYLPRPGLHFSFN